jgi:hypothetical protein
MTKLTNPIRTRAIDLRTEPEAFLASEKICAMPFLASEKTSCFFCRGPSERIENLRAVNAGHHRKTVALQTPATAREAVASPDCSHGHRRRLHLDHQGIVSRRKAFAMLGTFIALQGHERAAKAEDDPFADRPIEATNYLSSTESLGDLGAGVLFSTLDFSLIIPPGFRESMPAEPSRSTVQRTTLGEMLSNSG